MLRKLIICLAVVLALALALGATRPALAHDDGSSKIDVTLEGASAGPNAASFTATVDPLISGSRLQLQWNLPPGVELVGGPPQSEWANPVAGTPAREDRTVRAAGPGVYRISIGGGLEAADGVRYVQGAALYLSVGPDGAVTLSRSDPNRVELDGSIMPATVEQAISAAATRSPDGDPCFNVTGIVTREEHTPDRNGYRPMVRVPVRAARIEMREEDTLFDDSYGEQVTGSDGSFAFSFCDDDGVLDDELELYVRLHANLWSNGHDVVEVQEDGLVPPEDVYEFDSNIIESEGGTYFINFDLNREQSAVFNIADAILDAWLVWNANGGAVGDDAVFGYQAEVNWEADDEDDKTFYNGYVWDEITIADSNSNPDEWDDGVIIHEWTHQADDNYGCDDNPGGEHSSRDNNQDLELAFAEGFANYYQSAVRSAVGRPDGNFYLDGLGPGGRMGGYDLETRDVVSPTLVTTRNEAVAALLWDLEDSANDGQDRVGFTSRANQETFTHPTFAENGDVFDDTCTTWVYLTSWRDIGKQADKAVAAIIQQNVGLANFFGTGMAAAGDAAGAEGNAGAEAGAIGPLTAAAAQAEPGEFKWWQNLTFVVDNSASMAAAGKLNAVKTVMKEQVNDLAPAAKGVEFNVYTFNNTTAALQQPVQRKFYADLANPAIDSLAAVNAPDADCSVAALDALAQAAQLQSGGDVWLYTDRAANLGPGVDSVRRLLNGRQVRGSFAMLGGCAGVLPARMSDVTGGEINYLGNAANGSQATGIVPYLLTSLGTGGQFIYVREDQLGSAADILRAQVANSAGAGKWSDYVSDNFTYRWDRLEAGEYQWFPAESLGEGVSVIPSSGYVIYPLPRPFSFYGSSFSSVGVNQDGVIELDPCTGSNCSIIRISRSFLDVLSTDMQWDYIPVPPAREGAAAESAAAESAGAESAGAESAGGAEEANASPDVVMAPGVYDPTCRNLLDGGSRPYREQVCVYQGNLGSDWHIISVQGFAFNGAYRAYQAWLNTTTGEIRFQFGSLSNEAATAEIGLRRRFGLITPTFDKFLVSNQDSAGAYNGMGYKLTPAPPQPTRVYTVAVDALMEGVGFLQTGYSGAFEPMIVRDPSGQPVNCADTANVLCLTMDNVAGDRMVQYVQVNVNGKTGDWTATIDAAGSEATFTFSGLAASSIAASTVGERSLPTAGSVRLSVKLPRAADGNALTAWLQRPNGERFGAAFQLFDDGAHGDGRAGDGLFSLPTFTVPGKGVAFLWVQGSIGGQGFVRSDPVPYNFQPLEVKVLLKNQVYTGAAVRVWLQVTNHDNQTQCFYYGDRVTVPAGWGYFWEIPPGDDGSEQLFGVCIPAGGTIDRLLQVIPSGEFEAGPSGASGDVSVTFVERERGAISDSDGATVTLYREAADVRILNPLGEAALRPNGVDTATLTVGVYDYTGYPVQDGTLVEIATNLGAVEPAPLAAASAEGAAANSYTAETQDGRVVAVFTAPATAGDATVSATVNGKTVTTTVYIRAATAETVELTATPADLSAGATSATLLATLRDAWGDPLPGATVRIGIADDSGTQGALDGVDVFTGTTNALGQVQATFTRSQEATGEVQARAEYVVVAGGREYVPAEDAATIRLTAPQRRVYLPDVRR
jgi:hypothetical protein